MEIIELMKNSNCIWIILSFCSVISVPLAIYFGLKSLSGKLIIATLSSNELITNKQPNISKIEILYDRESVDKITVTTLTFWNKTTKTINKADIIEAAPLAIFLKSEVGKILEISVLEGDDSPNKISVSRFDDKHANITFDYLDKKEGGKIQVIHSGNADSIDVVRKIKGGKVKLMNFSSFLYKKGYFVFSTFAILILCLYQFSSNIVVSLLSFFLIIIFLIFFAIYNYRDMYRDYTPKNCRKKKADMNPKHK